MPGVARSATLHLAPPWSPRQAMLDRVAFMWLAIGVAVTLAFLAAVDEGSVLMVWDGPIQRWVESNRSDDWGAVFRTFSRLGSNVVVFSVAALAAVLVYRRCRALALALVVAVLSRPLLEFLLKELIDRDRPDLQRLVDGTGPSHPSGHVLASIALWGLLPPFIAVLTHRRWAWWVATATSFVLIVGIAASRVYLGVHWFSDVIGGMLIGALYLVAVETIFLQRHRRQPCRGSHTS